MLTRVRHTGLVVTDIQTSLKFYTALGFSEVSRDIESGEFIEQVTGFSDAKLEWVKLTLDGSVLLELLKYHTPSNLDVRTLSEQYPANLHGCSHIAYTTPNIEACCQKIKELGGSLVNVPANSSNGRVKVVYAYDPDGILIEIVEELPQKENVSG